MTGGSAEGEPAILAGIKARAAAGRIVVTVHGQRAMQDDAFTGADLLAAIARAEVLEDYPDARRGPCCLIGGAATDGRPLHIVCTTALPDLWIITVYEPTPPKWVTPTSRG